MLEAPGSWKGKEAVLPQGLQKERSPADTSILEPDLQSSKIVNLCHFKPQHLWQYVTDGEGRIGTVGKQKQK